MVIFLIVVRSGFSATIAFHEWGHLNGKLFLDRSKEIFTFETCASEEEKSIVLEKYPSRVIRTK